MQKVIMLPGITGVKGALFTKRLIVFHETFAPLGGQSSGKPSVAGTYSKILCLPKMRDYENIVLWANKYSGRNKNWVLYMFCYEVNRRDGPDTITVECFEKGQKFTSAYSFHR